MQVNVKTLTTKVNLYHSNQQQRIMWEKDGSLLHIRWVAKSTPLKCLYHVSNTHELLHAVTEREMRQKWTICDAIYEVSDAQNALVGGDTCRKSILQLFCTKSCTFTSRAYVYFCLTMLVYVSLLANLSCHSCWNKKYECTYCLQPEAAEKHVCTYCLQPL